MQFQDITHQINHDRDPSLRRLALVMRSEFVDLTVDGYEQPCSVTLRRNDREGQAPLYVWFMPDPTQGIRLACYLMKLLGFARSIENWQAQIPYGLRRLSMSGAMVPEELLRS